MVAVANSVELAAEAALYESDLVAGGSADLEGSFFSDDGKEAVVALKRIERLCRTQLPLVAPATTTAGASVWLDTSSASTSSRRPHHRGAQSAAGFAGYDVSASGALSEAEASSSELSEGGGGQLTAADATQLSLVEG